MTLKTLPEPPAGVLQACDLHCHTQGTRLWHFAQLNLPAGITWVGGGEGRGKTHLLRSLAADGVLPTGPLELGGVRWQTEPERYRQRVFWMDPRTQAHDQISATHFFANTAARYPTWDSELLDHLCKAMGLQAHQDKPLYMLSTGSKRKVWLAAALASGAQLTLLDMPFAALDSASISAVLNFLGTAAQHPHRAWVLADYVAPPGVALALRIDLGD